MVSENGLIKTLVVTGDSLGEKMAGPAIRALEFAKALSNVSEVRLATTVPTKMKHSDFEIVDLTDKSFKKVVNWADVIVFQGALLSAHPWIAKSGKIIVADLYDPMHLEMLEQQKNLLPGIRYVETLDLLGVMNEQLSKADFFLCASEKQRDFWLGQLAGNGRLNPYTYDRDTSLRTLIDIVPFGIQPFAAVKSGPGIRETTSGIGKNDKVIIWGGGIYNWFDPLTLIKAVQLVSLEHKDIRLFFMGTQHPNPHVPEMQMSFDARKLADELGITDTFVFFNEGWVPFEDRANYLLDADIGISTHLDHLETSFSFRTRILDYLWAGLPIISTAGDTFEPLIDHYQLGQTVPPQDVEALANAINVLLYGDEDLRAYKIRVLSFAESLSWPNVLSPLVNFVQNAVPAADRGSSFSRNLTKLTTLGRKTWKQRLFMYSMSIEKIGFIYTINLFLKNLLGRLYRKLKTFFQQK